MDVTSHLELLPAPCAVFNQLPALRTRPRFMLPTETGDWRAVTWGEYARQIKLAALFLASSGMKPGDRGAIFAPNRVEWISAALAIQAAGGVMVPIYPASTAEQAGFVIQHSDAVTIFVDTAALLEKLLECWSECRAVQRIVILDESLDPHQVLEAMRARSAVTPPYAEVEKKLITWNRALAIGDAYDREDPRAFDRLLSSVSIDQPGLMLYTSGTSGRPKGVPLTHKNVGVNGQDWLKSNAPLLEEGMVDLLWLPMSHIFGFGEACLGNQLGFTSYLCEPKNVLPLLKQVRPSVFMSVPSLWEALAIEAQREESEQKEQAKLAEITGGNLKFCLSGGAGLKREVKEFFHRAGTLIIEGYGLTEASPTLTLNKSDAFRFDSVGKPFPSVELRLAEDGEILARGPSIFAGYHKDPVATREVLTPDGWLKTGDIGRFTDDGFLQIIDRKKDILVTSGGKNIPPANIELRFRDDPFIAHLVVYGDGKKYLVAGVWLNEPTLWAHLNASGVAEKAKLEAARALIKTRIDRINVELASFETIKQFAIIEQPLTVQNGLLTPTLKIKRKKIYETFKDQLEALYR